MLVPLACIQFPQSSSKTPAGVEPAMNCFAGSRHAVWLQRQASPAAGANDAMYQSLKVVVPIYAIKSGLTLGSTA